MSNDIERSKGEIERAPNGKRVRTSKEQLWKALAPMFAAFPGMNEMSDEALNVYWLLLCDIDATTLAKAILDACGAHEYPAHWITVAAIREQLPEKREPGPRSESEDNYVLPEPPPGGYRMHRLPYKEDRQQRMERLRNTVKWESKYG